MGKLQENVKQRPKMGQNLQVRQKMVALKEFSQLNTGVLYKEILISKIYLELIAEKNILTVINILAWCLTLKQMVLAD